MHDDDLEATNSCDFPSRIKPNEFKSINLNNKKINIVFPAASWNVIRLTKNS
jgi:alpha-L-arabinofuranosidase